MSVTSTVDIGRRRWNGWLDPAFPIAYWAVQEAVTGDASGGVITVNFRFSLGGGPHSTLMYSLEQFFVRDTSGVIIQYALRTINLDDMPGGTSIWETSFESMANDNNDAAIQPRDLLGLRKIFLGRTSDPTAASSLTLNLYNGNGNVCSTSAQGYIWDGRSVLANGGPQRPPSGLYG